MRFSPRALICLCLVALLLATGTAAAQTEDPPADPPAEEDGGPTEEPSPEPEPEPEPEPTPEPTPADQEGPPDEETEAPAADQPKKKKGKNEPLPECEPEPPKPKKKQSGGKENANTPQSEGAASDTDECVPPRCEDDEVDLAPDEDEPNCIDPARLNRLIAGFEAAAAEEANALEELGVALDVLEKLNTELEALRVRLGEVHLRLAAARVDVGFAEIREQVAAETLEDVSSELAYQEDLLRDQAVDAYMGGDDVELATSAALLSLDNYADVETARTYARAVLGDQLATVDHVDALREAVVVLTGVVAEIEAATQVEVGRVADIEKQVEALIGRQDDLVAQSELEAEAVAEEIAEIQARKQVYADELRVTGVGGGPIGETLRVSQAGQEAPANPFRSLELPLEQTRIASPFGPRVHPIFLDTRLHAGVDMSGSAGEPIMAAGAGVVVYATEARGYGNTVVIDHGNTVGTLYAHMTADAVFVGMEVEAGDIIGFVGSTGFSTGPHLHFEVRINGQPVDPMPYLNFGEPS